MSSEILLDQHASSQASQQLLQLPISWLAARQSVNARLMRCVPVVVDLVSCSFELEHLSKSKLLPLAYFDVLVKKSF
jgi:hypothetical protein